MTVQEIKNSALLLSGLRDIPDNYVKQYINEIMDSLVMEYDEAGKKKTITISGIKDEWIDLPIDCVSIKRCFKDDSEYNYDEFLIENHQIQFKITGNYKIEYIAMQEHIAALTDTLPINIAFHEAVSYGVAYKETSRIFMHEDLVEGNNKFLLLTEFKQKSRLANTKAISAKKSRKRIKFADFF